MPLVSVIIPVYNGEKTIKSTIESVLAQSLFDFELIIVNSDSSDSTLNIISNIKDTRLKLFTYPQANAAVNRNRGLRQACAEFITFLDADDLWTPDKLEAQYNALQDNFQAAVAYSFTNAIDENGKFLRKCSHAIWTGNVYSNLLLDDFIGSGSNVMVRKQVFTEIGGFNESLTNAEDTDMWLRIALCYHFIPIKKVQVLYRISANSKSSNVLGSEVSNLKIIEQVFTNLPSSYQHIKLHRIANLYKYLSYKALTVCPGTQNSIQIFRFLCNTIKTDPAMLKRLIIYKSFLKLVIMTLLPPRIAIGIFNKLPRLFNMSTFFGYIKTNIS
jgi:glycosyltransferase involved in cell wall biosynthesis